MKYLAYNDEEGKLILNEIIVIPIESLPINNNNPLTYYHLEIKTDFDHAPPRTLFKGEVKILDHDN